jgi:hypothetical protein
MTPELIDIAANVLQGFVLVILGSMHGRLLAERKNRRLNAAKVECVECPHETAPKPLGAAMAAAAGHQEATGHRCMVVKAA